MKILSMFGPLPSHWLIVAVFSPSLRGLDAIGLPFLGIR
jgi:hypothetical protein